MSCLSFGFLSTVARAFVGVVKTVCRFYEAWAATQLQRPADAGEEYAPGAGPVGELAGRQEQDCECERVGTSHGAALVCPLLARADRAASQNRQSAFTRPPSLCGTLRT